MANKNKGKPQVINNIKELNLEIDYEKLANAIIESQNKLASSNESTESELDFFDVTLFRAPVKNFFSFSLTKAMAWLFYILAIASTIITIEILPLFVKWTYEYFQAELVTWLAYVVCALSIVAFLLISMVLFCILFNIAREIKKEQDRNYIISVFSGIVSFAALIVALVALFKGVG